MGTYTVRYVPGEKRRIPMIEEWISEVKKKSDPRELGMFLVHHGIVRATSKEGTDVKGMRLSYDSEKLHKLLHTFGKRNGIVAVKAWINEGTLSVGDDIMYALVAGKFRTDVLPALEELVSHIKKEVVSEQEFFV
jgi:molybdopterin synthase catalytic subunit